MALTPGARLGPYEIVSALGAGGMGEVYRARDTKLNRDVALKVLPDLFTHDTERVARFQREAKTLASLNHPNVGGIYGLEEANGVTALVLELVEGPTLADRIAQGPIPLDEALPIAKQIAEALEAAHEQGIIHRDLKPANIKVREDGTVKVLDFGLARAMESPGSSPAISRSPTITSPAMTAMGVILGTAAYMSPEQAKGRVADKRSDVWAFGCVLYEMLTGTRAFDGEDATEIIAAIVKTPPIWTALPADVPPHIVTLLQRCLEKDRKARVGDIAVARFVLADNANHGASTTAVTKPARAVTPLWRRALPWAVAAGSLLAAVMVLAQWAPWRTAPSARVARFVITMPDARPFQVGATTPFVAISPDGSRLVYRISREATTTTNGILYQRALGQVEATLIPGTEGANGFFFSPDGNWIGFGNAVDNTLKRVPVSGGPSQTICALDGVLRGGSWGPDDTIVFATNASRGLRRVPAAGGEAQVLTKVDPAKGEIDHFWPEVLPDGNGVIFSAQGGPADRSRVVALSLSSGSVSDVVRGSQPHFSPTGHLVYAQGGTLSAVRFSAASLEAVGNPVPVLEGVAANRNGSANYAIAKDGSLLYVKGPSLTSTVGQRTLVWVNRKGQEEPIKVPPRAYTYARLAPDGTRVALDARDENDIWIWDLARQTLQRLTNNPGMNRQPVWTPDGKRVAFSAEREGVESVHWQAFDGSGAMERLSSGTQPQTPRAFSPDGTRLIFGTPTTTPFDLGVITLGATRTTAMLLRSAADENNGEISPDGRWLAYESDESRQFEIYVRPFPNVDTARQQVSTGGGTRPLWSRNGRELFYYVEPDTIMALPVRLGADVVLGNPQVVVKGPYAVAVNSGRHYDVSPDGQRFLLLKDMPLPEGQKPPAPEIHLVLNWAEELKAKVPVGK